MSVSRLRFSWLSLVLLAICGGHASAAGLPPQASAVFSPSTVVAGGSETTTYTLTISNPNGVDFTNVQFTSSYPAGLVPDLIGNYTCGTSNSLNPPGNPGGTNGGSGNFSAGGFSFTLNTLPAGDSCTVIFLAHASPVVTTTLITQTTSTITSSGGTGAAAPATLTVNPQVATSFSISGLSTVQALQQNSITINALDQVGNLDTVYNGSVNLTSTEDPNLIYSSGNPITLVNGTAAFNVSPRTVGTWTVTATDSVTPSITGTSNSFTVTPGPTSKFLVSAGTSQTAGTSFSVTVTAVDPDNNVTPAYSGTVSFSSTDTHAGLPSSSTLTNGTGTFAANLHSPGSQTITAADAVNSLAGTSAPITVNAAPAPTLAEAFSPTSVTVNNNSTVTFTITNATSATSVQSIGFTDTLPAGLVVAGTPGLAGTCLSTGGGVIAGTPTATAGSGAISLASLSLAASASCTFAVNVTPNTSGTKTNTTGAIASLEGGTGSTATATLTVNPANAPTTTTAGPGGAFTYGQSINISATVTVTAGGAPVTTGTMTFFDSTIGQNIATGVALNSSGVASTTTSTLTAAGAGGVHIIDTIYVPGSGFAASSDNLTVTVAKAVLTVTAQNATMPLGGPLPSFTANDTGFVNSETPAVLTGSPSLTTTATAASPTGPYTITAAIGTLSATNYSFTFVNGTLTVLPPPVSFVVSNLNDSGAGSLRAAISGSNASPSGGVISFTVTGKITLASALPAITATTTITGPGASSLAIDGGGAFQVFYISAGITASISGVTIQNGLDTSGATGGGGIRNDGTLTLSSCIITGNSQTNSGFGGGIYNNAGANLTVNQCTISNNTAAGGTPAGGGLYNAGTATIGNSTFSGNSAAGSVTSGGQGGAIYAATSSTTTVVGSTISGNQVTDPGNAGTATGGAISSLGAVIVKNSTISANTQAGAGSDLGGGIVQFSGAGRSCTLTNTIVAGNTDADGDPDLAGTFISGGNNLIGVANGAVAGFTNGVNGDQVGTSATPLNPQLSALAGNGGPTLTMLPGGNSPALGAGSTTGFLSTDTDQRGTGFLRLANGVIDIGAVQLQGVALTASAGTPQSAGANSTFVTALAATATESCASCTALVPGVSVTFTAPGSGASGAFGAGATVLTNGSGVATAPAFTANATAGGPYNVTATGTTPDQATPASAAFALTNVALAQTISGFGPIGAQTYGAVFVITGVTSTSGGAVTFTSTTLSVCTVSGTAVSVVGTGGCTINANQAGSATYAAAPTVPQSFTANKAPLTVSVQSTSKAYGAALPAFSTSSVTGLTNGDTVGTTITIGFSTTATAASAIGAAPITAIIGGASAGNYTITNNAGVLTISTVGLTVAVAAQTKAYGAALPTLTGAVTGLVNGDTVGGTITVAYSTTATASSSVGGGSVGGAYPITALVGGSAIANYTVTNTPNVLTVTQVGLTVTVAAQTKVYGAALPTLTGTVTGLVNGDVVGGAITVSYSTTALASSTVAGGPYPVTALVGGSAIGNYTLTNTPNSLTITKAPLTVTANSVSIPLGTSLPPLSASISGFVNGDTVAVVTGTPAVTTAGTSAAAGSYPITVSAGTLSAANYTFAFANGTLTVLQPNPQPAFISIVSGNGQSGVPGAPLALPLVVEVTSNLGPPLSNGQVTFTLTGGSATLSTQIVYTASDGTAQITVTPTGSGPISMSAATSNATIQPVVFNETGLVASAPPQLTVLPSSISLTAVQGGDDPQPASIAISNTGAGTLQWTSADSGSPSWLTLGAASGATPAALPANFSVGSLTAGTYKSTITITSGSQQQTVPVTLTVVAPLSSQFSLAPAALVVNAAVGSTAILRVVNVANGGAGTLNWNATVGTGTTWLTVSPASGSSVSGKVPSPLSVQFNPSGLPAGQYLGNISLSSPGVPPANVQVVLNISPLPNLISGVPAIELRLAVGSGMAATTLPITTNTGAGVSFTATGSVTNGSNWLTLSGASGVTPASILVSGSNSGLSAGNYVGYVSVQSPGAANTLVVPVVLDLGNFSTPGTLSASPGGILLTGPASSTPGSPLTKPIILNSDAGTYSWTATALAGSGGSWLTVSPSSGTGVAAQSVTVSANLTGLAPCSYSGQVAIGSTGTSNTELIVPVTLVVSSGSTPVTSALTLQPVLPSGDFVASVDVPVALQASLLSPTGTTVIGATIQVTFTSGDLPVTLTDVGNGTYVGVWTPQTTGPVSLLFTSANAPTGIVTGTVATSAGKQPAFTAAGVVNSADFISGAPLGVGSISTIFGQNLSVQTATATSYPLPLSLGGASVTINGVPAPLFYASPGQLNFFVPYELAGQTTATIVVSTSAGVAEVTGVPIAPESPGFYLEDAAGDASAVHLTGQIVSAAAPASGGETIEVYATGLGSVSNVPADGTPAPSQPLAFSVTTPVITIGGVNAQVSYAGLAPGFAGLYQLNVVVPTGLPSGANPMTISVGPLFGNTAVLQVH